MIFFNRSPASSLRVLVGERGVVFLKKGELDGVRRSVWWFILDCRSAVYCTMEFEGSASLSSRSVSLPVVCWSRCCWNVKQASHSGSRSAMHCHTRDSIDPSASKPNGIIREPRYVSELDLFSPDNKDGRRCHRDAISASLGNARLPTETLSALNGLLQHET